MLHKATHLGLPAQNLPRSFGCQHPQDDNYGVSAMNKATCPICQKPVQSAYTPFCSARCKQIDLGNWLSGAYAIPAGEAEDDPESPPINTETDR